MESGLEKCPHCGNEFVTDQGDYHVPGRVECPACGYDFDAEHDSGYEDAMAAQDRENGCPECGARPGMPHDLGCPLRDEAGPDPDRYREGAGFDKFMDRIIVEERRTQKVDAPENNPQRLIAGKYQDRPMNRVRMGGKR